MTVGVVEAAPPRPPGGELVKYGTLLFAASMLANASNYIFRIFMSHRLGANYKDLDALLAVFMILSIPASAIQTVTAKYTSDLSAQGKHSEIADLFVRSLRWISLVCLLGLILFLASARLIADFLQIGEIAPVALLGVALFAALLSPAAAGLLQGLQRFLDLGLIGICGAAIRLVTGVALVLLGFGVSGAIGASVVSSFGALVLFFFLLRPFLKRSGEGRGDSSGVYRFFVPVILFLACQSLLSFVDSVIVKHYLPPDQADVYAKAAIVGKAFLFLPTALAMVLFPKASELHTLRESSLGLLTQAIGYSLAAAAAAATVCFLFAGPLSALVGGTPEVAGLIRYFGLAVTPVALLQLLINHDLAVHRSSALYPLAAGTIVYTTVLIIFHETPRQVLAGMGISGILLCVACLGWTRAVERRSAHG